MSYVRWSSFGRPWSYDSDLYIYDTFGDVMVCWSTEPVLLDGPHGEPYETSERDEMIEHVKAHIAAGHSVPDFVIPRIEAEQGFN